MNGLDRAGIAARIPHAGTMRLLERVINWDTRSLRCTAVSHRDADNPLREPGGLPVWAGIEYAAQAAAVHGALCRGDTQPRTGVLASLRDVEPCRERLDDIESDLLLDVTLLHADPAGAVYRFDIRAPEPVLSGRFTLMFIPEPAA